GLPAPTAGLPAAITAAHWVCRTLELRQVILPTSGIALMFPRVMPTNSQPLGSWTRLNPPEWKVPEQSLEPPGLKFSPIMVLLSATNPSLNTPPAFVFPVLPEIVESLRRTPPGPAGTAIPPPS